jgi:glycosyltransferase involved in cell wall biosynthesis
VTKIAILFTNYGPYHIARVSALQQHCRAIEWDVVAIELARYEAEYDWITDIESLSFQLISVITDQPLENIQPLHLIRKLYSVLSGVNPDTVAIAGYFHPAMLSALLWCLLHKKPAILLSETTEDDVPRAWWKETLKGWIVRRFQAALVGGKPHKRYLIKLDFPEEAIFLGYDVVDNAVFHPSKIQHLPHLINQPYFLAVNRFIPKKNLLFLLSCYATYRQLKGEEAWHLVLCGDGPLRSSIEKQIVELGLQEVVHLPGFLQQNELLPYFAHANCFIHASLQEQWGLVVNEAMASGLPVLVSDNCGCFEDLVLDEVNGFGFDPEDRNQLTNLMLKVSSNSVDLKKMSQVAIENIHRFSPDNFALGLMEAMKYATNKPPSKIEQLIKIKLK